MPVYYDPISCAYGQNIKPSDGALKYFYEVGTTTPKASYKDPGETIPHAHPVVADSTGRFDAIFISGSYKVRQEDKNGDLQWEEDNITGAGNTWSDQGDFDSSTNAGDYPASGNDNDIYRVTEEFTLNAASGAYRVFVGDFIKANKNGATGIDADWDIIKGVSANNGVVALTAAASIATNCKLGTAFAVTLDQNSTLANATGKRIGQTYHWYITQAATPYTLAFGTDFVFSNGDTAIKTESASVTVIKGTVISSTVVRCEIVRDRAIRQDFENAKFDFISTTEATFTADWGRFVSESGDYIIVPDIDVTFDIEEDLIGSEPASKDIQCWIDSAQTPVMIPDLEDTTDGTAAGFLVDSGNTFFSYGVKKGDPVYNTDDTVQTKVKTTPTADGANLELDDDIFVSGENYKIHIKRPAGLGTYTANPGSVYNNASSNIVSSKKNGIARITESFWYGQNGYGSSSTKVYKYTNEVIESDPFILKVENDATLGLRMTAQVECKFSVSVSFTASGAAFVGISKNCTQLTTSINTITTADKMALGLVTAANLSDNVCFSGILKIGDVIRFMGDGAGSGLNQEYGSVYAKAEEII